MTAQEIIAFARIANLTKDCAGKRVVIQRGDNGLYLCNNPGHWSSDIKDAHV